MASILTEYKKFGKTTPLSLDTAFLIRPTSVKETLRMLKLPKPNVKKLKYKKVYSFGEKNAQGIAYGYDDIWFLSSESNIFIYEIKGPDLHNPSRITRKAKKSLHTICVEAGLDSGKYDHIGDITYSRGLLLLPIRTTRSDKKHLLVALSKDLKVVAYSHLRQGTDDSWCTFNPWNNMILIGKKGEKSYFIMYDVSRMFDVLEKESGWGKEVPVVYHGNKQFPLLVQSPFDPTVFVPAEIPHIQGIAFSPNGRIYVAWYLGADPWHNYVYAFNMFTGQYLGKTNEYNFPDFWDEIEGISIHPRGYIYVAVAINKPQDKDYFQIFSLYYDTSTPTAV